MKMRETEEAAARASERVLANADDEAVHDLRVAVRRLRVLLKVSRPLFTRFLADAVREPFTAFHRATSELRDEEVLEETLGALGIGDPAFERWMKRRKDRENELRNRALARLARGELDVARKMLDALLALPTKPKRKQHVAPFARRVVRDAQQQIEKLRDTPVTDADGLHRLRIAYKNLRYASELLADALPPDLRALAEPAKKLQTRLGDLHDVDVAITTTRAAFGLAPITRAKVVRALRTLRAKRVAEYLEEMGLSHAAPKPKPLRRPRRRPAPPLRATLSRP